MKGFCLEVTGDFACFTRPELKVERMSYDVITPSAARAIFEAIFWKPAIRWNVTKIEVLNPIRWISIRRNEVSKVATGKFIDIEDERQQRAGLLLRDVRYRLHANFTFIPLECRQQRKSPSPEWLQESEEKGIGQGEARKDETEAKYCAIFTRRASRGQYFNRPYLGCREFSCRDFRLIKELRNEPNPISETRDLGLMLYDMDFSDALDIRPMFYRAQMREGVILVPSADSEEIFR